MSGRPRRGLLVDVFVFAFLGHAHERAPFARGDTQRHDRDPGNRAQEESDGEYDCIANHTSSHGVDTVMRTSEAPIEAYSDVRKEFSFGPRCEPRSSGSELEGRLGGTVGHSENERCLLLVEVSAQDR